MEVVQVKAVVPRTLKREVFSALALREQTFRNWLAHQMQTWLQEVEETHEEMAVIEGDSE